MAGDRRCPVTVGIPTYRRSAQLQQSLEAIARCDPAPAETIIHVDGGDAATRAALERDFPHVRPLGSSERVGPGGGRNRIVAAASHSLVASFDDDSYPCERDYFARLEALFAQYPQAAVLAALIVHRGEREDAATEAWTADFVGCGCAYRREAFLQTSGYLCLPLAYGMEEADLALRLNALGWQILKTPQLRVFHNTQLEHHNQPAVTAASIANQALLAYLRYPALLWGLGLLQCLNRIRWLLRHGRRRGVLQGIRQIPGLLYRHRQQRQALTARSIWHYRHRQRHPLPVATAAASAASDRARA